MSFVSSNPPAREASPFPPLPRLLTRLIGREREVADASALLRRNDVRLVTFTGPGGVGKTKLAIQVASELAEDTGAPVSVGFVPLAQIRDPGLVLGTIAQAFGILGDGEDGTRDQLAKTLADHPALLVLDNFEHLLD